MAQHPQLLSRLAVFILSDLQRQTIEEEAHVNIPDVGSALLLPRERMALAAGAAFAQDKEIVFGLQCDRTGATQTVGVFLCPGYHDYIALVNSKGGIEGYKIRVLEIDHEYKVPPAMEAHERFKKEGAVLEGLYGTPQTAALTKKLEEDKILGTSPGLRHRRRHRRQALSLHLPDRGQLLVAGRGRRRLRQEGAGRQPQGQEDRLSVL